MEPLDQWHRTKPAIDSQGLRNPPAPERYTELEAAYHRALQVAVSGRYARGDTEVAENVARHVIAIWKEEPACSFLRLTNLAVHRYEVERARARLFEDGAGKISG